jgi:selenoprotein W-related protein
MTELLKKYEFQINSIKLIPSDGGRFEVKVDNNLVYSKLQTGQHIEPGELIQLVGVHL